MNLDHPTAKLSGLIASAFTPMHPNGELNLDFIPTMVDHLIDQQIRGVCVCSGTGEGPSLTIHERKQTLEAFVDATKGRIPVIAQVGHNSLYEARALATHAADVGANGIAVTPPTYFKPSRMGQLIESLQVVTAGAPELPFIYYHNPSLSAFELDWPIFLKRTIEENELPSLAGIKFIGSRLSDLETCANISDGRLQLFYGTDERLMDGILAGAHGAIGSTYNFSASLHNRILSLLEQGQLDEARQLQKISLKISWAFLRYGTIKGQKEIMNMIGLDCGPPRLPNAPLTPSQNNELREKLKTIGFFE